MATERGCWWPDPSLRWRAAVTNVFRPFQASSNMCGICGVLDYSGRPIGPALVNRIRDTMLNRGPDDAGFFIDKNIGLGHRRLSIIDTSAAGHQPFLSENGRYVLVFSDLLIFLQ